MSVESYFKEPPEAVGDFISYTSIDYLVLLQMNQFVNVRAVIKLCLVSSRPYSAPIYGQSDAIGTHYTHDNRHAVKLPYFQGR
jgi:hypothetical protein